MKYIALLLAGSWLSLAANADEITWFVEKPTGIGQQGRLGLFDTSLGTLTGLSLTLTGKALTTLRIDNRSAATQVFTLDDKTGISFGSSLAALDGLLSPLNPLFSFSMSTDRQSVAGNSTLEMSLEGIRSTILASELGAISSSFTAPGGGDFFITGEASNSSSLGGLDGDVTASVDSQPRWQAMLTYSYDAGRFPPTDVPEPASLALVGLGLAGLAGIRRRKVLR